MTETVWQSISTAPRDATWIKVRDVSGKESRAHFAHGDGDGEQPAFGPAFFEAVYNTDGSVSFYADLQPQPTEWLLGSELPQIGSKWRHHVKDSLYTVLHVANMPDDERYPTMIVYRGERNTVWARRADDWHRSMIQVKGHGT